MHKPATARSSLALAAALSGLCALSPTSLGQSSPCLVAGDALGVELHCAAVLALATPPEDPMVIEARPVRMAGSWPAPQSSEPAAARSSISDWALWPCLMDVFLPETDPIQSPTVWMAIVY